MLADYIEEEINCNGKLGSFYKLYLRINHSIVNGVHNIKLRLRIGRIKNVSFPDLNTDIVLKENQVTAVLRVSDRVLIKKPIALNFSGNISNITLLEYEYEINNEQPLVMNYCGDLLLSDDSEYLEDTSIKSTLFLKSMKETKLFIDVSTKETPKEVDFLLSTNVEPDFIECKLDTASWNRLPGTIRKVLKTESEQIIQFRGKFDNKYSYSQAFRVSPILDE